MKRLLLLTIVGLFVATACSDDDDASVATDPGDPGAGSVEPGPDDGASAIDGSWTLVMLVEEGDMAIPLPAGATIDLWIDGTEVGGTAACNSFGGSAEIGDGGSFSASELFQTEMACDPPELMEMESRYFAALGRATSWMIEGDQLTLAGPDAVLTFDRTPDPVDADIESTVWQLDSFYDGSGPDGAVTNHRGMEAVTLEISEGAATLRSPCGTVAGTGVLDADGQGSIGLALTAGAAQCSDADRVLLDDTLARLGRVDRYQVETDRLTLSSGDDPVIGFVAG